jgi:hypothetical protein
MRAIKVKYHSPFKKREISIKEKLSFRDFANKVHNKENGFYDLEEFQFEMAEWRLNNLKDVSMILATRGIGKSDIITCLVSLYLIYINPLDSLIIITDKATKAQRLLKYIKDIIIANMNFFSDIFDEKDLLITKLTTKQNRRKEPSIFYGSLGETLRGIHPNYAVFDDILTRETSWSSIKRESVFNKYDEVKKLTNNILVVGNVCHHLDLYSKLRDNVPAFEIYHSDTRIPDYLKPDIDKQRMEGSSEANIQANYFGVLLADEELPFYDISIMNIDDLEITKLNNFCCYYDFSNGKNDANALSIAFLHNFKCYIIGFAKVCRWSDFIDITAPILNDLGIKQVYYESNTTGYEPIDLFTGYGISSQGIPTTTNKINKINKMIPYTKDIVLLQYNDKLTIDFIEQFKFYSPKDSKSKDDAVDSAIMCLIQMGYIR